MQRCILIVFSIGLHHAAADECKEASKSVTSDRTVEPLRAEHLPGALWVARQVLVGGTPRGEAGFRELSRQGIRTIISVDHAIPDARSAKQFGLRYVHLPVGYSGLDEQEIHAIAALLKTGSGRVYLHCHHGKHRAPAATAASCVAAGILSTDEAKRLLQIAGTSEHYRGLFASVDAARIQPDAVLDVRRYTYSERAEIPATAARMVEIDRLLEALSKREDVTIEDREHDTLLMEEQFKELMRMESTLARESDYIQAMHTSLRYATALRKQESRRTTDGERKTLLDKLRASCVDCHRRYRNR